MRKTRKRLEVTPGQVWENCDPRQKGRAFKVLALVADRGDGGFNAPDGPARYARIKVLTGKRPGAVGSILLDQLRDGYAYRLAQPPAAHPSTPAPSATRGQDE